MQSVTCGASQGARRETFSSMLDFLVHLAIFLLVAFAFLHLFALESGGRTGKAVGVRMTTDK
jgi:hypothetical protein